MTVDLAAMVLRDMSANPDQCRVRIDDILKVVGRHYNVARADLLSPRRARSVVVPRQIGMYLAKKLTPRSLPEIGRRFGGRDHSTVLHAVRKIEELMQDRRPAGPRSRPADQADRAAIGRKSRLGVSCLAMKYARKSLPPGGPRFAGAVASLH